MPQQKHISSGVCAMCKANNIPKRSMEKHLAECSKQSMKKDGEKSFHLLVTYPYDPRYWLHLEANESAGLRTLDASLRDIWLECCGHMSHFIIGKERYVAPEEGVMSEYGDKPMREGLKDVLQKGMRFGHEYDFGSTTELELAVLNYGPPKSNAKSGVRLLARNEPIGFLCSKCGNPATEFCAECQWGVENPEDEDSVLYCDKCANDTAKHQHDEGMLLPVVNSPRMGVCGYEG